MRRSTAFDRIERLSDPALAAGMLDALGARAPDAASALARANLLRRSGDLAGARNGFRTYLQLAGIDNAPSDDWTVVPPHLSSPGGYAVSPLAVIDDLLPL